MRMSIPMKAIAAFSLPLLFASRADAIPLDPASFESFESLRASSGALTINTDGVVPLLRLGTNDVKGVLVSQGSGLPDIAVFTFDDISLTGSVTISGSGSRPLALLSKGGVVITPTITLSGGNGAIGSPGAAGAWGGAAAGAGPGAGSLSGGGGFGGRGGNASLGSGGGSVYGDLTIALQGGSGGATGFGQSGAGAGAIEIGALGAVSVGAIVANGGSGATSRNGTSSDAGGSGGAVLLHGTTVSAGSLQARGGSAANANTSAGGGGGGGRILVAVDTFTLGGPSVSGDVSGGFGGQAVFSGGNGQRGVFDLRSAFTVVGPGQVFTPGADGRMALTGGANLLPEDMVLRSGGAAVASHPYVTSGLLTLESGSAFTAISTFRIDHLVRIASGSGVTAIGRTDASAPIVLGGGTFSAIGGLSTGSRLEGHGAVIGPVHGAPGSELIVSGGTLTLGDANRVDGVDWQGEITIRSSEAAPSTLQLNSRDRITLADTALVGIGARLATLNGAHLEAGRTIEADAASRISGALRNDGSVNGPSNGAVFLTFDDAVTGAGSYLGNVRFAGGFSPGASPALVHAGTVVFDADNILRMELGGRLRGSDYDAIEATGTITLGGVLEVALLTVDGTLFTPIAGDTFDLLRATQLDGRFAAELLPTIDAGLLWRTGIVEDHGGSVFRLSVVAVPEPQTFVLLAAGLLLVARMSRRRGGR